MRFFKIKFVLVIIVLAVFVLESCRKQDEVVPYAPIMPSIRLFSSDPEFFTLNITSGHLYREGASRGVLIYRNSIDQSSMQNNFRVYDRHCPYDVQNPNGIIHVDSTNNFLAVCHDCKSSFFLYDGSVHIGPAKYPLRAIRNVIWNGDLLEIWQ